MKRRILFVIRGKLGDTLINYMSVRRYADRHPDDEVWLLTRKNYAALLGNEAGVRVIGFDSRLSMYARLFWLRISQPEFDVLAVLWGFGKPIRAIGRMVRARRKIYLDGRFGDVFPEHTGTADYFQQIEPSWRVIRVFDPEFTRPAELNIPGLRGLRLPASGRHVIGIAPLADEPRRCMDRAVLDVLIGGIAAAHPGASIHVFINPHDHGADALSSAPMLHGAELAPFPGLNDLVNAFAGLTEWYGTDTGLYHLAAAMGIPATLYFGPTRPETNVMPGQRDVQKRRLAVLGEAHCEQKDCQRPLCLYQAIRNDFGLPVPAGALEQTPIACPLRVYSTVQLHLNRS